MSVLRKLAGETALYGLSSILARVVNFLLLPIYTAQISRSDYGIVSLLYAWMAVGLVIYTLRLETAYFRHASDDSLKVYPTAKTGVLIISLVFTIILFFGAGLFAGFLDIGPHKNLIQLTALIMAIDAICELPFARLRMEKRAKRFVLIKSINIFINVSLNIFLLILAPYWNLDFYQADHALTYIFIANLSASFITFILLIPEWKTEGFRFDRSIWSTVFIYSWPLMIVGLSAVINDAMTRQFLDWFVSGTTEMRKTMVGEYSACVKFAVFISLFIQAFRYAAEPFFFQEMHTADAREKYSKITSWFTYFMMLGFLVVLLYIDFYKHILIRNPAYLNAIRVVPIVLLANVVLGIYYNISNWYRLTDRTRYGMYSALIGVALTILFNYLLVPRIGYMGTAWTMLIAYSGMALITYIWGLRFYPVPYEWLKIGFAICLGCLIYVFSIYLQGRLQSSGLILFGVNTILVLFYLAVIGHIERAALKLLKRTISD